MTDWNFWTRRRFVQGLSGVAAGSVLPGRAHAAFDPLKTQGRRVVVVGGGFGGTIIAKTLRMGDPKIEVVLINRDPVYTACPTSNLVISGTRTLEQNRFGYGKLKDNHGIVFMHEDVKTVDAEKKTITGVTGTMAYDRLVLAPGIDFRFDEIAGYDPEKTPLLMPHAWKAGEQTLLLRRQLEAMPDGGTFVLSIPPAPFRAPGGPYERICMVAAYFKRAKPASKIIALDANPDIVMKGHLFRMAWEKRYPGMVDYRPNQRVIRVEPEKLTVVTASGEVKGDVVSVVPPQKAALLAHQAGLVGPDKFWCPVNPTTFESTLVPNIHVVGDACIADPMPKTGFSANAQAKVCALNMVASFNGKKLIDPSSANVTYSWVSDAEAISTAAVYRVTDGKIAEVPGSGGASAELSELENIMGLGWITNVLKEMSI